MMKTNNGSPDPVIANVLFDGNLAAIRTCRGEGSSPMKRMAIDDSRARRKPTKSVRVSNPSTTNGAARRHESRIADRTMNSYSGVKWEYVGWVNSQHDPVLYRKRGARRKLEINDWVCVQCSMWLQGAPCNAPFSSHTHTASTCHVLEPGATKSSTAVKYSSRGQAIDGSASNQRSTVPSVSSGWMSVRCVHVVCLAGCHKNGERNQCI
jgi:hypothetical protein